jgi:hypothetical protein
MIHQSLDDRAHRVGNAQRYLDTEPHRPELFPASSGFVVDDGSSASSLKIAMPAGTTLFTSHYRVTPINWR